MRLSANIIYIFIFSLALLASEASAQTPTPTPTSTTVSILYDGPPNVYESNIRERSMNRDGNIPLLENNEITFTISLNRVLDSDEFVHVDLNLSGIDTINDVVQPNYLTIASPPSGVSLVNLNSDNPQVQFTSGSSRTSIVLHIRNDTNAEPDKTFTIALGTTTGTNVVNTDAIANSFTANLLDDDRVIPSITASPTSVAEGGNVTLMITLTRSAGGGDIQINVPRTVFIAVSDYPGSDFIPQVFENAQHTVALNAVGRISTGSFTVSTVNNDQDDSINLIRAEISEPSGFDTVRDIITVAVIDDEPVVSLSAAEGIYKGENAVFTVQLNTPAANDTMIGLMVQESGGQDFIAAQDEGMQTVVVSAGSTQAELSIPTALIEDGNHLVEGRVSASLTTPMNNAYTVDMSASSAESAIVDMECGYIIDVDIDDDGLIEICDLEGLDAMRHQLDGSGYKATEDAELNNKGCDEDGDNDGVCRGYELRRNLDFDNDDSYSSIANKMVWTTGTGWQPIGGGDVLSAFSGNFEGNANTIDNLYISRPINGIGLFRETLPSATIRLLTLSNVDIRGESRVGALVGNNQGIIGAVDIINGRVIGSGDNVGGAVGISNGAVVGVNVLLEMVTGGSDNVENR